MKRAVFLDRDDTIIRNVPYLGDPARVELMPGAREGLILLREAGWPLYIVSNQSGVGRGLITKQQVRAVNEAMEEKLGGGYFADYYLCYAAPDDPYGAEERKPSPAMLQQAAQEHDLDLRGSVMIGDRGSDVMCGKNAGCVSILVLGHSGGDDVEEARKEADFVARDLQEAAMWWLARTEGEL
ncbi:MAG: HAD family hydrolase [Blastochloris sp.]|nr:HAD family hydrolase [Blastochloris sp.]